METTHKHVLKKQAAQKFYHNKGNARNLGITPNDKVMVRNFARGTKWLPATVKSSMGPVTLDCELDIGGRVKRHVDQVWKRYSPDEKIDAKHNVSPKLSPVKVDTSTTTPAITSPSITERHSDIISPAVTSPSLAECRTRRKIQPPDRLNL